MEQAAYKTLTSCEQVAGFYRCCKQGRRKGGQPLAAPLSARKTKTAQVTLDGTASTDPDGPAEISTYTWSVDGPQRGAADGGAAPRHLHRHADGHGHPRPE